MMKTVLAFALLLAAAGCQSGHVSVLPTDANAQTSPQGETARQTAYSDLLAEQESPASVVFFTSVDTTVPGKLLPSGVGFLPTSAETKTAYVFPVTLESSASPRDLLAPWNNGVLYVKSVDGRHDSLGFTDILSLDASDLFVHNNRIKELAASKSNLWAAWIDGAEKVYVLNSSTGKVSQLELNNFIPMALSFGPAAQLIVSGAVTDGSLAAPSRVLEFQVVPQPKVQLEIDAKAVAISDSGRFTAEVKGGGAADSIVVFDGKHPGRTLTIGTVLPDSPAQPAWSGDRFLAYVVENSDSSAEVRIADLGAKESYHVEELAVPAAKLADVACPVFKDGALYFGGRNEDQYVIYKAAKFHGQWHTEVFARPSRDDQGFVCPRASE